MFGRKRPKRHSAGFSLFELLVLLLSAILLLTIALPVLASTSGGMGIAGSKRNLMQLHMAHQMYAADYNGNQWVNAPHDLAEFGDTAAEAVLNWIQSLGGNSHPMVDNSQWMTLLGWAIDPATGSLGLWRYKYNALVFPMGLDTTSLGGPGSAPTAEGFGYFRVFQSRGFNPYVNGKFHDETFLAPRHAVALNAIGECLHGRYDYCVTNPIGGPHQVMWSSYSFSPSALYHPDFWNVPVGEFPENTDAIFAQFDNAFHALPYASAKYPDLKTHISEHFWLQNNTAGPCNDAFGWQFDNYDGCNPYYFNASIHSAPVTLFYDGHVRLLPLTEVKAADDQIGVWRRDTPMGEDGFFSEHSAPGQENPQLSHHILTNGGILGRDTLGQ